VRARPLRLEVDRLAVRLEGPREVARVEQVEPEAVPPLGVPRLRVAQLPIDLCGLLVLPLHAEACGRESGGVRVDVSPALEEGPQER